MKLSVLIPAYNEEKTVDHIISCVKNCGIKDLEIVVVNDCSSDGTKEALEKYASDPAMVILHHEVNKGKGLPSVPDWQKLPGMLL